MTEERDGDEKSEEELKDDDCNEDAPSERTGAGAGQGLIGRLSTWRSKTNETLTKQASAVLANPDVLKARESFAKRSQNVQEAVKKSLRSNNPSSVSNASAPSDELTSRERSYSSSSSAEASASASDSDSDSASDSASDSDSDSDSKEAEAKNAAAVESTSVRGRYAAGQNNEKEERLRTKEDSHAAVRPKMKNLLSRVTLKRGAGTNHTDAALQVQNQTSAILQSSAASHMESIISKLSHNQYVLLLGRSMLGVNLKQSYLKSYGVYVDFIVPNGNAYKSKVVFVGDTLLNVADKDVSKGTILHVPAIIANASRPAVLIFSKGDEHLTEARFDSVHLAVAMLHDIREKDKQRKQQSPGISNMPITDDPSHTPPRSPPSDADSDEVLVEFVKQEDDAQKDEAQTENTHTDANNETTNPDHIQESNTQNESDNINSNGDTNKSEYSDQTDEEFQTPNTANEQTANNNDDKKETKPSPDTETTPVSEEKSNKNESTSPKNTEENMSLQTESSSPENNHISTENDVKDDNNNDTSSNNNVNDNNDDPDESFDDNDDNNDDDDNDDDDNDDDDSLMDWIKVPVPTLKKRQAFLSSAKMRNNEHIPFSVLMYATNNNSSFQRALKKAFLTCCLDARRRPFLTTYLSKEDKYDATLSNNNDQQTTQPAKARLLLYVELLSFREMYPFTPSHIQIDNARRIAYKYFLPTIISKYGFTPRYEKPKIDMRSTVANDAVLSRLDAALKPFDVGGTQQEVPRDLFLELQKIIESSLTTAKFASFLFSDDCARMRAYLRGTAPYRMVPLDKLINWETGDSKEEDITTANQCAAHNHFQYILMHLICLMDNEPFGENEHFDANVVSKRIMGSMGGITAVVYIRRSLLQTIQKAADAVSEDLETGSNTGSAENVPVYQELLRAFEHLWETFVAPGGGLLDSLSHSKGTREALDGIRRLLIESVSPPRNLANNERGWLVVQSLVKSDMKKLLLCLAEGLLYDYGFNLYPKFREHKFHEWMCSEANKYSERCFERSKDKKIEGNTDYFDAGPVPKLPEGCITRLLRRSNLPDGVSTHKTFRRKKSVSPSSSASIATKSKNNSRNQTDIAVDPQNKELVNHCNNSLDDDAEYYDDCPNADFAIVFGTDDGMDSAGRLPNPAMSIDQGYIHRFACVSVQDEIEYVDDNSVSGTPPGNVLTEEIIPATLESYAVVPPFRERPFSSTQDDGRLSVDGWEVSLVNFMIPNAQSNNASAAACNDSSIYGVSLVFRRSESVDANDESSSDDENDDDSSQDEKDENRITELTYAHDFDSVLERLHLEPGIIQEAGEPSLPFHSPLFRGNSPMLSENGDGDENSLNTEGRRVLVSAPTPEFNRRLGERRWSERMTEFSKASKRGASVGIALISGRNVVPAMRETLSLMFKDYTKSRPQDEANSKTVRLCNPLVDILGNLSHHDVEKASLRCILEPYMNYCSSRWVNRPLSEQRYEFVKVSGDQLVQSLPPVPLALLFITAILEQKIILSSSRRSILLSAATAIVEMLKPLEWAHLFVPLVPAALATDLVQYPAPFILGIPSEDSDSIDLLNSLPSDVTLVDLDVGRVILAKSFAADNELSREENNGEKVAGALRSQVLCLAEAFGGVLGGNMHDQAWCCDSPLTVLSRNRRGLEIMMQPTESLWKGPDEECVANFTTVLKICKEFISELLAGLETCCVWIEEYNSQRENHGSNDSQSTVLFDEDRFLHVKNLRAQGRYLPLFLHEQFFGLDERCGALRSHTKLALSLDEFDLILESFLRGQGMSSLVSSQTKQNMIHW